MGPDSWTADSFQMGAGQADPPLEDWGLVSGDISLALLGKSV